TVLGGWQINGISTVQSGIPFSPQLSIDNSNVGVHADRPNLIGDPHLDSPSPNRWYNAAAFCANPSCGLAPFTYGNAGRNILTSDGVKEVDLSLSKNHHFREKDNVQFRIEAFNVFNHPNFGIPNAVVDSTSAGQVVNTTTSARQIQLGLRIVY